MATRSEARQRLCWAHGERLALAARAAEVCGAGVVEMSLNDRAQVQELQEQCSDGTTVALNARAHLAVVLYTAGKEADARAEMDVMVGAVSNTARPTVLASLLKLASTPAGKGLSYGVARFAWAQRDVALAAEWFTKAWAAQYDLNMLAEVGSCFASCLILKREELPPPPVPPLDLGDGRPTEEVEPEPEPDPVGPPTLLELAVRAEAKRLTDTEVASAATGALTATDRLHMGVVLADAGTEVRTGDLASGALTDAAAVSPLRNPRLLVSSTPFSDRLLVVTAPPARGHHREIGAHLAWAGARPGRDDSAGESNRRQQARISDRFRAAVAPVPRAECSAQRVFRHADSRGLRAEVRHPSVPVCLSGSNFCLSAHENFLLTIVCSAGLLRSGKVCRLSRAMRRGRSTTACTTPRSRSASGVLAAEPECTADNITA